jgi:hypothetical protein
MKLKAFGINIQYEIIFRAFDQAVDLIKVPATLIDRQIYCRSREIPYQSMFVLKLQHT